MSYSDDEEEKIPVGLGIDEEDDLGLEGDLDDPLADDLLAEDSDEPDELSEGFAGLDGSSTDY